MTGRELVSAALRILGALAPGESLAAREATDGLASANRLLGSWSNEGLTIYAITEETPLTLTPGEGSVTLGLTGDITTRPQSIEEAVIREGTTDFSPMRMLTHAEYAAIPDKSTQSNYPYCFYDDGGYPLRTLKLYPVPSAANQLVLFTKRALTEIATLDTEIEFPPGYDRALIYNLAIELAPEYGRSVSAEAGAIAVDSKTVIQRSNHRSEVMTPDAIPAGSSGRRYNIYTGGY